MPRKSIPPTLKRLARSYDASFVELKDVVLLTEYAVGLRFPDDFYMPPVEEVREAFRLAQKVKNFVLARLK